MCITEEADVHLIANVEKKVPREWINEDGTNVKPVAGKKSCRAGELLMPERIDVVDVIGKFADVSAVRRKSG